MSIFDDQDSNLGAADPQIRIQSAANWFSEIDRLEQLLTLGEEGAHLGTRYEMNRAEKVMRETAHSLTNSVSFDEIDRAVEEGRISPQMADKMVSCHHERQSEHDHPAIESREFEQEQGQ